MIFFLRGGADFSFLAGSQSDDLSISASQPPFSQISD